MEQSKEKYYARRIVLSRQELLRRPNYTMSLLHPKHKHNLPPLVKIALLVNYGHLVAHNATL